MENLTNDKQLSGSFMGGGVLTRPQIKSRVRDWGIAYKATKGLYIFSAEEFSKQYEINELKAYSKRKSPLKRINQR
jgi:hypothetical protein